MKIRPCIDIHNGAVKQIVGMTAEDAGGVRENFVSREGTACYAAIYREKDLPGGHVILLNGKDDPYYEADV
ncbi:MAG: phosphoribosylformimino-5-aminoimidazole carboxamide ribotide isomerase, partial [Lachnospiraceae bacterium]|nr:phosphoribosylformimino-5-aminoimidazole carboxamide ribotide isomerase [Lachnospiraceae bacterium]